jgi:hypothetical protein
VKLNTQKKKSPAAWLWSGESNKGVVRLGLERPAV